MRLLSLALLLTVPSVVLGVGLLLEEAGLALVAGLKLAWNALALRALSSAEP
jgi:hypothetical protein